MQLFQIEIRRDWQELDRQKNAENARLWWFIRIVALLSVAGIVLVTVTRLVWPWETVLRIVLSFGLFSTFSLWIAYRTHKSAFLYASLTFIILGGSAILAGFTSFLPVAERSQEHTSQWPLGSMLFLPLVVFGILWWSRKRFPDAFKQLGLSFDQWTLNLIIGIATGGSLGFHFLLATFLLSGINSQTLLDFPVLAWTLLYRLSIAALGEELLLRGLSFPLIYQRSNNSFSKAAWSVSALNVLIYAVPLLKMPGLFWSIWMVVYLVIFSFASTFLRYRQGSLLASIASNVAFYSLIATIIPW